MTAGVLGSNVTTVLLCVLVEKICDIVSAITDIHYVLYQKSLILTNCQNNWHYHVTKWTNAFRQWTTVLQITYTRLGCTFLYLKKQCYYQDINILINFLWKMKKKIKKTRNENGKKYCISQIQGASHWNVQF